MALWTETGTQTALMTCDSGPLLGRQSWPDLFCTGSYWSVNIVIGHHWNCRIVRVKKPDSIFCLFPQCSRCLQAHWTETTHSQQLYFRWHMTPSNGSRSTLIGKLWRSVPFQWKNRPMLQIDISDIYKATSLSLPLSSSSNKIHNNFLTSLLTELAYLCMLYNLQLAHIGSDGGQLEPT